jgi:hypothetical protein
MGFFNGRLVENEWNNQAKCWNTNGISVENEWEG